MPEINAKDLYTFRRKTAYALQIHSNTNLYGFFLTKIANLTIKTDM